MGVERSADWYDEQYKTWPYLRSDPERTPWTPVWESIIGLIEPDDNVLDIGCGPGHLAALREMRGVDESASPVWYGIDFSEEAVKAARERNLRHATFSCAGLPGELGPSGVSWHHFDVVVLCEVLEHIADDLSVLEKIPTGKRVIFSVPNFDSDGHVRWFDSMIDVLHRYGNAISIWETYIVRSANTKRWWYVVTGARR